ncbi:MAG: carboxypeptidase-like regulatory domain-containing protein, partial [Singulisphaera sp.]
MTFKRFRVISRAKGPLAAEPREAGFHDLVDPANYGADCTVAVEPTRPIEGVVRDLETKEPIPGASVTAFQLSGSTSSIEGLIRTKTDAQGRYRLVGLPKEGAGGHKLVVYPPLDRPYFITNRLAVPASPGMEPVTFDIALRRGNWATGRVTEIRTGKPVANALVDYFPFLANERAKDYPNFDPAIFSSIAVKTRYRTDKEGRFRIAALPGRGVVTVYVEAGTYRSGFGAEAVEGRTDEGLLTTYDRISPSQ